MTSIRRHQGPLLLFAGLFLFVTLSAFNLHAEERTIRGKRVPPGESYQAPPARKLDTARKMGMEANFPRKNR